ncbi:MAG: tyrosyl-tRNA synthetase [Planctomycetota bacterium]|jgi:tyrosyl-tRNA synthetase
MSDQDLNTHLEAFQRGAVDLIETDDLKKRLGLALAAGRGLRVKFGMDPSSADLHMGHAVQLRKLRDLQDLGHTIVLIVGDATAMVGDPSGRNKLRPQLSREAVETNLVTYTDQASLVLDMERTEVRRNSEWFDKMEFQDVLKLASRMTVAQMIQRDTFSKRMQESAPIGIHEFLYPLMQGWDSVQIHADVELGGTDQLFNLLVGRQLQEQEGQHPQVVLTQPLINGLDGRKMSKSYDNTIQLTDAVGDVFGKTMSITDEAMATWYLYLTRLPADEIDVLLAGHPREAKARLAQEMGTFLHGEAAGKEARAAFDRQFKQGALPEDIPERAFGPWPAEGLPLTVVLREVELASSGSEARRLIQQGGVSLDGEVIKDPKFMLTPPSSPVLVKVGKRKFLRLRAE